MTDNTQSGSDNELLKKIDSIMPQCGEIDCATCTKRHKRVLAIIRNEKLKLLDRLSSHQEDLFWWTGGEYEKTKAVDMRAIAAEREQLDKLGTEL